MPEGQQDYIPATAIVDTEYDEVSLVRRGADQLADVVLYKSETPDKVKMTTIQVKDVRGVLDGLSKGDKPGHPFRGNQYSGGSYPFVSKKVIARKAVKRKTPAKKRWVQTSGDSGSIVQWDSAILPTKRIKRRRSKQTAIQAAARRQSSKRK